MRLILYSKPGCHLCEGLHEKLSQITAIVIDLEIRDITTRDEWFQAYQYEIPVLYIEKENQTQLIPRFSPRATIAQVEQSLQKYLGQND